MDLVSKSCNWIGSEKDQNQAIFSVPQWPPVLINSEFLRENDNGRKLVDSSSRRRLWEEYLPSPPELGAQSTSAMANLSNLMFTRNRKGRKHPAPHVKDRKSQFVHILNMSYGENPAPTSQVCKASMPKAQQKFTFQDQDFQAEVGDKRTRHGIKHERFVKAIWKLKVMAQFGSPEWESQNL